MKKGRDGDRKHTFSSKKLEILPPSGTPPLLNSIWKYFPWKMEPVNEIGGENWPGDIRLVNERGVPTKREELLFLRVLALPKASRRGLDSRMTFLIFSRSPVVLGEMEAM